jgi:putative membrane protein
MKYLMWLVKAAIFFTLFAFALNNQQEAAIHFFFGYQWQAPMVLIVLLAFSAGMVVGALGMLPHWWRRRSKASAAASMAGPSLPSAEASGPPPAAEPEVLFVQPDAPADRPRSGKLQG